MIKKMERHGTYVEAWPVAQSFKLGSFPRAQAIPILPPEPDGGLETGLEEDFGGWEEVEAGIETLGGERGEGVGV
jgi:hypothetical protein